MSKRDSKNDRSWVKRWLTRLLDEGTVPGLQWVNEEKTKCMIPWENLRFPLSFNREKCRIFLEYAKQRGDCPTFDDVEAEVKFYSHYKQNLRSALHKAKQIQFVKEESMTRQDVIDPYRIYSLRDSNSKSVTQMHSDKGQSENKVMVDQLPPDLLGISSGDLLGHLADKSVSKVLDTTSFDMTSFSDVSPPQPSGQSMTMVADQSYNDVDKLTESLGLMSTSDLFPQLCNSTDLVDGCMTSPGATGYLQPVAGQSDQTIITDADIIRLIDVMTGANTALDQTRPFRLGEADAVLNQTEPGVNGGIVMTSHYNCEIENSTGLSSFLDIHDDWLEQATNP